MRGRTFFLLGLSVGLAALLVKGRVPCLDTVRVVVLEKALPAGSVLTLNDLHQAYFPLAFVGGSVVTTDLANLAIGRTLVREMGAGDVVRFSDFAPPPPAVAPMVSADVQKKARVVSLHLPTDRALGGWLAVKDHVDILARLPDPVTAQPYVQTLLQNVIVMKITPRDGMTSVDVLVIPEEADALLLAQEAGALSLSLRNPDDVDFDEAATRRTTLASLLEHGGREPPRRSGCGMRLIDIMGPTK